MKNSIKILSILFLTAIYCLAIDVVTNTLSPSSFQNNQTELQEKPVFDFSTKLFCNTSRTESSVNNYNNIPTPNLKDSLTGFWAIFSIAEQLLESEFSQYTTFSRNILVNNRKADLIFPFHYFW